MPRAPPRDPATAGTASRGPCQLYVLPCAWEDLLKLGISRDPLSRLQALHPRWYEFFDLDRALLVQFDAVREARAVELAHKRALRAHNAPAPLTVDPAAGGTGEWFRGAYAALATAVQRLEDEGHPVHVPALPWIAAALRDRAPLLYAWTEASLDVDALETAHAISPAQRRVRDVLDALPALGIDLAPWLPEAVRRWHGGLR